MSPGLQRWDPTTEGGLAQPREEPDAKISKTWVLQHPLSPGQGSTRWEVRRVHEWEQRRSVLIPWGMNSHGRGQGTAAAHGEGTALC